MDEYIKGKLLEVLKDWWKPLAIVLLSAALLFANARENAQTQDRLQAVATETHSALCTFKADLQARFENTKEYLAKHPGKEPIPGITRADLRRSLDAQRSTLDALSVLECDNG
jgi:hypothetical protein